VTTFNEYKSELLRWARRKDQLLTVVGALVIFCAFLAKEVYGDRARRAGESLEVAAMNYQTQSELIVIDDTAHRIELAVDEEKDMAEHSPSSFKKDRARLKDAVDNLIFVLGGQVNILKQLRSKLPHDQDRGCSDERIANLDALVEKAAQMNGEETIRKERRSSWEARTSSKSNPAHWLFSLRHPKSGRTRRRENFGQPT